LNLSDETSFLVIICNESHSVYCATPVLCQNSDCHLWMYSPFSNEAKHYKTPGANSTNVFWTRVIIMYNNASISISP